MGGIGEDLPQGFVSGIQDHIYVAQLRVSSRFFLFPVDHRIEDEAVDSSQ